MVDLARRAFSTNNFDLAVEIYERSIKENGPAVELYLGLADSLSRAGGNFSKAFEIYSQAFRLGSVSANELKHLVTSLIDAVSRKEGSTPSLQQGNDFVSSMFVCMVCRAITNDPVTIPCGHTFCRKCLEKDVTKTCQTCGVVHYYMKIPNAKSNILLTLLLEKWFPNERIAVKLKAEGNGYFARKDFDKAIELYTEALTFAPRDHLLASNRSHAYASSDRFREALQDAERVVSLQPDWPKGYFRKGCALVGLGRFEDSVVAFLQCLALDPGVASVKHYLSTALHRVLSSLPPDDVKSAELQSTLNPSPLRKLINADFDVETLLPQINMDTLQQLKTVLSNTITMATNYSRCREFANAHSLESLCTGACVNESYGKHTSNSSGEIYKQKCTSAPNSSPGSPHLAEKRTRSYSFSPLNASANENDVCLSRKRSCEALSPTSSPYKHAKPNLQGQKWVDKAKRLFNIAADLLDVDDFECSLCYRLLYEPVTTPCGHVFCRQCLNRCLDHRTECPLCKSSLAEYLAERRQAITVSIQTVLETYFTEQYEDRRIIHEEEIAELAKMSTDRLHEIPVFVCTLAYPSLPCPLHIFEPRYRLMIRQCMESGTRQFGMCLPISSEGDEYSFADYGTVLEIRDVQYFPDGRSVVDTVGGQRFKVISRGLRDGYNTAQIQYLHDSPVEVSEIEELRSLQWETYKAVQEWFTTLPYNNQQRIQQHFGVCPPIDNTPERAENGVTWVWWAVAVLPLDSRIQLTMLSMKSLRERLQGLKRVLTYLRQRRGQ